MKTFVGLFCTGDVLASTLRQGPGGKASGLLGQLVLLPWVPLTGVSA